MMFYFIKVWYIDYWRNTNSTVAICRKSNMAAMIFQKCQRFKTDIYLYMYIFFNVFSFIIMHVQYIPIPVYCFVLWINLGLWHSSCICAQLIILSTTFELKGQSVTSSIFTIITPSMFYCMAYIMVISYGMSKLRILWRANCPRQKSW